MTVRDEPISEGRRWINCEFQCPPTMSAEELHALGNLFMEALMECEWAIDPSVSTARSPKVGVGGDFSFVISPDYEFPPVH